jgi:hypothetical protein
MLGSLEDSEDLVQENGSSAAESRALTWLAGMITSRAPLARWTEALDREPDDIKVVVELTG